MGYNWIMMANDEKQGLTVEKFVAVVMARLPIIPATHDHGIVAAGIRQQHSEGWSLDDAIAWNRCLEEVNPLLDEATALERMERISSKYAKAV